MLRNRWMCCLSHNLKGSHHLSSKSWRPLHNNLTCQHWGSCLPSGLLMLQWNKAVTLLRTKWNKFVVFTSTYITTISSHTDIGKNVWFAILRPIICCICSLLYGQTRAYQIWRGSRKVLYIGNSIYKIFSVLKTFQGDFTTVWHAQWLVQWVRYMRVWLSTKVCICQARVL